ncbi:MAG TPA: hypothetical protein PLU37_02250, partial [Chitinophagaceae bacterium]|nr:hypothetical protein [Chitinophagaceae bacterium]
DGNDSTYFAPASSVVTDHGALSGLGDDDHPQYLLTTAKAADSAKLEATTPTSVGLSLVGATNAAAARTAIGMRFISMSGLTDDTATSITPSNTQGFLLIRKLAGSTGACIAFDAISGTAYCMKIAGSADIAVTTGVLTGTSGADGKLTISAATNGLIYINNRLGATVYLGYYCL